MKEVERIKDEIVRAHMNTMYKTLKAIYSRLPGKDDVSVITRGQVTYIELLLGDLTKKIIERERKTG